MAEITRLAKCRMELNMTQQEVSDKARVPYPTYQKLDNGTTDFSKAQVNTALRIAKALDTTVENLCDKEMRLASMSNYAEYLVKKLDEQINGFQNIKIDLLDYSQKPEFMQNDISQYVKEIQELYLQTTLLRNQIRDNWKK